MAVQSRHSFFFFYLFKIITDLYAVVRIQRYSTYFFFFLICDILDTVPGVGAKEIVFTPEDFRGQWGT